MHKTPLGEVLNDLWSTLDEGALSEEMRKLEDAEALHTGSKSQLVGWEARRESIELFYEDSPDQFDHARLDRATAEVRRYIPESSLVALTVEEVYERSPKTTMWGLPYMSSDPENHQSYIERAMTLQSVDELFLSLIHISEPTRPY